MHIFLANISISIKSTHDVLANTAAKCRGLVMPSCRRHAFRLPIRLRAHAHLAYIAYCVCVCVLLRGYIKFNIFISAAPNISPTWRDALPKPKHIHSNIYSLRFIFVHCMRIRFFRTIQVVASELRCKLCADSANTMARWTCR